MTPIRKTFQFGDQTVVLETGEIARQADGAVMVNVDDTVVLVSNVMGLSFFPVLVGLLIYTFRRFGDHKTSRIFAVGLMWMYILAMAARTSTLWAGSTLAMAAAAETAIFSSALMMLGLAVDRRLGFTAFWFAVTSVTLALVNDFAIEIYCAGSVAACLGFIQGPPKFLTPRWIR